LRGLGAWQAGNVAGAEVDLTEALALAQRQRKPGLALRCGLSLGALEASRGRSQDAARRLRALLDGLTQHGRSRDARWAGTALACWARGDCFDANDHTPWEPR
jgi:hypothetical protein